MAWVFYGIALLAILLAALTARYALVVSRNTAVGVRELRLIIAGILTMTGIMAAGFGSLFLLQ